MAFAGSLSSKSGRQIAMLLNIHTVVLGFMGIRRYTLQYLATQGFAVVNAITDSHQKHTFPAPLEDVGAMVEWGWTMQKNTA